jgi:hypothetical protein
MTRTDLNRAVQGARRRIRRRSVGRALLALCLAIPAAACVQFHRGGLYPEERDEVFVDYFENKTFYRDVQFELTEQVTAEILSRPGLSLSRSRETAEVLLTGTILKVHQIPLSEDPSREITSATTVITVEIEVRDGRTGEIIKTKRLTQRGEYVPQLDEDVSGARQEAYVFLARDIIRELETEF